MASKYCRSKKGRSHGAYRRRLEKAGLTKTPTMTRYRHADPKMDRVGRVVFDEE